MIDRRQKSTQGTWLGGLPSALFRRIAFGTASDVR
jgi:hypothetical protein